jgi:hypothetical protein
MILILILIAWLAIIAIVVNACRAAASGDEMLAHSTASGSHPSDPMRPSWHDGPALTGMRHIDRASASRSRSRGTRDRSGRCAAGS